jgi:penicillin-binding protein 1C
VADAAAVHLVTDILADNNARAGTFGLDSALATRGFAAVKTGTSKDMRDNWAIGYSQRYTVGVWVGNASGAPMWDVSGTSGAAPVWAALMNHLHQRETSRAPAPPAGVVRKTVRFAGNGDTPLEAARSEWFIQGTEQALFAIDTGAIHAGGERAGGKFLLTNANSAARITAPADGSIVALDPDIPPNRQRLSFAAEGHKLRWLMDGKEFARGNHAKWLPWPGRHRVTLVGAGDQVLDEIRLEVRGAGVRSASLAR